MPCLNFKEFQLIYAYKVYAYIKKKVYKMLRIVFEMPTGTPYMGMLNERGMWPFSYTVKTKQLMWYHTLLHSDGKRVSKQILMQQSENYSEKNWANQVTKWANELQIDIDWRKVEQMSKERFKKDVKEKI